MVEIKEVLRLWVRGMDLRPLAKPTRSYLLGDVGKDEFSRDLQAWVSDTAQSLALWSIRSSYNNSFGECEIFGVPELVVEEEFVVRIAQGVNDRERGSPRSRWSWPGMEQYPSPDTIPPVLETLETTTMTKSDLIAALAARSDITAGLAENVVNAIFDTMAEALVAGEGIEVRGFGSFSIRNYEGYMGRNPKTGEPVEVAPKRLPFFKVGKELKEAVDLGRLKPEGTS